MGFGSKQTGKDSPLKLTNEARLGFKEFMRDQMSLSEGDERWRGMCESLQRQSHGFPARFASAYAHMVATPRSERLDVREAPVGAFVFVDDVNDSNRFGHIVGKWRQDNTVSDTLVVTNDVADNEGGYDPGNVTVCQLSWFQRNWGDSVQFATVWFGDDTIALKDDRPPETAEEDTKGWVERSIARAEGVIELMKKAVADNDGKEHPNHEAALKREIADQRRIIADLKKLLP